MKYIVKVADKSYEVEIEDLNVRPVIAHVDGQKFEVSPESEVKPVSEKDARERESKPAVVSMPLSSSGAGSNEMTAPLPGTVIEVFVKTGEHIEMGHVILVIEAMKMKNSIRSTRAGKIVDVLVSAGQTVAHKEPLVRFG
jgi:biotin carboxyl carrier protein